MVAEMVDCFIPYEEVKASYPSYFSPALSLQLMDQLNKFLKDTTWLHAQFNALSEAIWLSDQIGLQHLNMQF